METRCQHCNKAYSAASSLQRHLREKHADKASIGAKPAASFRCLHCSRAFTRSDVHQRHVKTHTRYSADKINSACLFCARPICRKDYLKEHRRKCLRKLLSRFSDGTISTGITFQQAIATTKRGPSGQETMYLDLRPGQPTSSAAAAEQIDFLNKGREVTQLHAEFYAARRSNDREYLDLLLEFAMKLSPTNTFSSFRDAAMIDPLVRAISRNHTAMALQLIPNIQDLNSVGFPLGCSESTYPLVSSPLQVASSKGNSELVRALLIHGADPHSIRGSMCSLSRAAGDPYSPICLAARNGHIDVVRNLAKHSGGDVSSRALPTTHDISTPVSVTASGLDIIIAESNTGSSANHDTQHPVTDGHGITKRSEALLVAVREHDLEGVSKLLSANVDIMRTDRSLDTALTIAIEKSDTLMVRLLLSQGPRVRRKVKPGCCSFKYGLRQTPSRSVTAVNISLLMQWTKETTSEPGKLLLDKDDRDTDKHVMFNLLQTGANVKIDEGSLWARAMLTDALQQSHSSHGVSTWAKSVPMTRSVQKSL